MFVGLQREEKENLKKIVRLRGIDIFLTKDAKL